MSTRRTTMLRVAILTGGALLIASTAISFFPSNEWWIRIFDFPRRQIGVLLALTLVASALALDLRRGSTRALMVLAALALIAQGTYVLPYTRLADVEMAHAEGCDRGRRIRLVIANVQYDNRNSQALLALIRDLQPDMVLLTEPGAWWEAELASIERDFPYVVRQPQEDTWGLLLYSRLELVGPEVRFLVEPDIPSVHARVRLASGDIVRFYGVHPRPPRPGDDTGERDTELMIVAREVAAHGEPAIVAGDLNDVAWSRTTRRLQQSGGLQDPRVGRGVYATFNANLPPGLRWPLDHVFFSHGFALCGMERLPHIGSDHFPLLVESVLTRSRSQG